MNTGEIDARKTALSFVTQLPRRRHTLTYLLATFQHANVRTPQLYCFSLELHSPGRSLLVRLTDIVQLRWLRLLRRDHSVRAAATACLNLSGSST